MDHDYHDSNRLSIEISRDNIVLAAGASQFPALQSASSIQNQETSMRHSLCSLRYALCAMLFA
jgi:hypothetical protein